MVAGCSTAVETFKTVWGSSTRALEEARSDAAKRTYTCNLDECYDAVLALARAKREYVDYKQGVEESYNNGTDQNNQEIDNKDLKNQEEKRAPETKINEESGHFDVFINNRTKHEIVVMGVPGAVDTTEVGIFFTQPGPQKVQIEISSLSSGAKRAIADIIFGSLDSKFSAVDYD